MNVYPFPSAWSITNFELRLIPNQRVFVGHYTPTTQVIDLLGERWHVKFDLAPTDDDVEGAEREAFFDRLKGAAHAFSIHHIMVPRPNGTLRGSPTISGSVAQLANVLPISCPVGSYVLPGDMLKCNGQLFRVMERAQSQLGIMYAEVEGRTRTALSSGMPVLWNKPTAQFQMKDTSGVPVPWVVGGVDGSSIEAIEVWS